MSWIPGGLAALSAGFDFLLHNHADCSSTRLLQAALLIVISLGVGHFVLTWVAAARLRRSLERVDLQKEPAFAAALYSARRLVDPGRTVEVFWADDTGCRLAASGYFRPAILISRGVIGALSAQELEAALAHELRHVRRRDALRISAGRGLAWLLTLCGLFSILLFQTFYAGTLRMNVYLAAGALVAGLVTAGFAGRVVAGLLSRRAERACDDAAARGGGGPLAAAAALVKVARLGTGAAVPAGAAFTTSGDLEQRIRRLMAAGGRAGGRGWRMLAGRGVLAVTAGAVLLVGCAFVWIPGYGLSGIDCPTCELVDRKSAHWAVERPRMSP